MRSLLLVLATTFLVAQSVCATPLMDDFSFLGESPEFVAFVDAVRSTGDAVKAEQLRQTMRKTESGDIADAVLQIRSATMLARLYTELIPKNLERARSLLTEAEVLLPLVKDQQFFSLILSAEIDSIWYLVNPKNLGKGINSNAALSRAYRQFPLQVSAILMKANSMLYAPAFAGRDLDGAQSLLLSLLEQSQQLNTWDKANLYSSLGYLSMKRKQWQTAQGYLLAAKVLYGFDPNLDTYLKTVEEHL
ncbi:MAG: hypothetical protein AB7C91_05905 [Sphaerochaeta sp.]|jgi:hypothetical protein|uniref:hypothetical protein n=1 Tax=Sphaerochaeta sp. TaxID=1972642 RepID=UPI003D09FE68